MNVSDGAEDLFKRLDLNDGRLDGIVTRENVLKEVDRDGGGQVSANELSTWMNQNMQVDRIALDRLGQTVGLVPLFGGSPEEMIDYQLEVAQSKLAKGDDFVAAESLLGLAKRDPKAALDLVKELPPGRRLNVLNGMAAGANINEPPQVLLDVLWKGLQGTPRAWRLETSDDAYRIAWMLAKLGPAERDEMLATVFSRPQWVKDPTKTKPTFIPKQPNATYQPAFAGQVALMIHLSMSVAPAFRHAALRYTPAMLESARLASAKGSHDPTKPHEHDQSYRVDGRGNPILSAYYGKFPNPDLVDFNTDQIQMAAARAIARDPAPLIDFMIQHADDSTEGMPRAMMGLLAPPNEAAVRQLTEKAQELTRTALESKDAKARMAAAKSLSHLIWSLKQAAISLPPEPQSFALMLVSFFMSSLTSYLKVMKPFTGDFSKANDAGQLAIDPLKPAGKVTRNKFEQQFEVLMREAKRDMQRVDNELWVAFDKGKDPYVKEEVAPLK